MKIRKLYLALPIVMLIALVATSASAYYTYSYSGSMFTEYDPLNNPMNFQSIQGYFTVDSQLAPNAYYATIPFTSFSFSANGGDVIFTASDPTVNILAFEGSTFNGQLNGWNIFLSRLTTGTLPEGNYSYGDSIHSAPNVDRAVRSGSITWTPPPLPFVIYGEASVTYYGYMGQWTSNETVPEPATMLLLGLGLMGLAGLRREFCK